MSGKKLRLARKPVSIDVHLPRSLYDAYVRVYVDPTTTVGDRLVDQMKGVLEEIADVYGLYYGSGRLARGKPLTSGPSLDWLKEPVEGPPDYHFTFRCPDAVDNSFSALLKECGDVPMSRAIAALMASTVATVAEWARRFKDDAPSYPWRASIIPSSVPDDAESPD